MHHFFADWRGFEQVDRVDTPWTIAIGHCKEVQLLRAATRSTLGALYLPSVFAENRSEVLHAFMREQAFGAMSLLTDQGLDVVHLPFFVDGDPAPLGQLRGHVSRANSCWHAGVAGDACVVSFQGPHAYVSPAWYPSKRDNPAVVPTWNYLVVVAHGHVRWIEDRDWLRSHVEELTNWHERDQAHPWRVSDAPAPYLEKMLGAIVGVEVTITRLLGKWKLGQNRSEGDRRGMQRALTTQSNALAQSLARAIDATLPASDEAPTKSPIDRTAEKTNE